jgi:2-polyprenyl-3-methyl-5-hydroxy-6-metoxy-1,4-benzoquinol methylase
MTLVQRIDRPEIMDTQKVSMCEMKETLAFLETTNKIFGGADVFIKKLSEASKRWNKNQTIHILDVGTGSADIPLAIAAWAREHEFKVQITGIDLMDDIVSIAKEKTKSFPEIKIEQRDLFTLTESYDYIIANLLLHHVPPSEFIHLLKTFDRLAKRGIIISDLLRSTLSYAAVSAFSYLKGNWIVRHDGPLSVRRAFTLNDLNQLIAVSGLNYLRALREPWFRVSLSGEKIS